MANALRISEAAALALHAMAYLAEDPERTVSTRQLARQFRASEAHLAKVLQRLARQKLVTPLRGPAGGFVLARPPQRISLLDVYEAIEGRFSCPVCLFVQPVCARRVCIMGGMVGMINRTLFKHLTTTRLSSLAKQRKKNQKE